MRKILDWFQRHCESTEKGKSSFQSTIYKQSLATCHSACSECTDDVCAWLCVQSRRVPPKLPARVTAYWKETGVHVASMSCQPGGNKYLYECVDCVQQFTTGAGCQDPALGFWGRLQSRRRIGGRVECVQQIILTQKDFLQSPPAARRGRSAARPAASRSRRTKYLAAGQRRCDTEISGVSTRDISRNAEEATCVRLEEPPQAGPHQGGL